MKIQIHAVILAFFAITGCTTAPVGSSTSAYEIFSFTAKSGKTVYGLQCRDGSTLCHYKWETLCAQGKTMNSDPDGNIDAAPAYARDRQNRPFRMFICQQ